MKEPLFLIAGGGRYPALVIEGARAAGVPKISVAAFEGETLESTAAQADEVCWMRVGQLGKLLDAAKKSQARQAMMAGQIAPKNLFDLRPDVKALVILASLKQRNAETLFGEVANQLSQLGITLLPATCFLESHLAPEGHIAGPELKPRDVENLRYGFSIAKETSRLDIGQTVIVKNGTILAVEAFEGTNDCIRRGGALGKGDALMIKVTKPRQDPRFDIPCIGERTLEVAKESGLRAIGIEASVTLLLDRPAVAKLADATSISLYGIKS